MFWHGPLNLINLCRICSKASPCRVLGCVGERVCDWLSWAGGVSFSECRSRIDAFVHVFWQRVSLGRSGYTSVPCFTLVSPCRRSNLSWLLMIGLLPKRLFACSSSIILHTLPISADLIVGWSKFLTFLQNSRFCLMQALSCGFLKLQTEQSGGQQLKHWFSTLFVISDWCFQSLERSYCIVLTLVCVRNGFLSYFFCPSYRILTWELCSMFLSCWLSTTMISENRFPTSLCYLGVLPSLFSQQSPLHTRNCWT